MDNIEIQIRRSEELIKNMREIIRDIMYSHGIKNINISETTCSNPLEGIRESIQKISSLYSTDTIPAYQL